MKKQTEIHIGTSGWNYDGWIGTFYPEDVKQKDLLGAYAQNFKTVEVNNSFYNTPSRKSVESWTGTVPDNFIFSCKANGYITHRKKLKDPDQTLTRFLDMIRHFDDRLGPVLFQLPPRWHVNTERLESFLDALPDKYRYAFEFRDQSWLCDEVYDLLKDRAALCFYDYKGFQSPEIPTADFIYVRLHGPQEKPYEGAYSDDTLKDYAKKFRKWSEDGYDIYCYFDNDQKARAPFDARKLREILSA